MKKDKSERAKGKKARTGGQEGRKLARLEIISAVIYEALLAFQLCISGRGNELTAKEANVAIHRYYASYISNSNPLIPTESRSCSNYTSSGVRLSREL